MPVGIKDVDELADELKKAADATAKMGLQSEPIVIINADKSATHQSVIDVLEAARIAGLARITFATQSHAR